MPVPHGQCDARPTVTFPAGSAALDWYLFSVSLRVGRHRVKRSKESNVVSPSLTVTNCSLVRFTIYDLGAIFGMPSVSS